MFFFKDPLKTSSSRKAVKPLCRRLKLKPVKSHRGHYDHVRQ
jgi:hypothetical protein